MLAIEIEFTLTGSALPNHWTVFCTATTGEVTLRANEQQFLGIALRIDFVIQKGQMELEAHELWRKSQTIEANKQAEDPNLASVSVSRTFQIRSIFYLL